MRTILRSLHLQTRFKRCSALLAGALLLFTAPVLGQGVRVSAAPVVDHINWEDQVGLEDATFFGGRLGLDFGSLAGLEGFYFTRSNINTELGRTGLSGPAGAPLANQDVDIANYGVDLTINLGAGRVVPFVKAGAGVFDVRPESSGDFDQVMYQYGGGIKMDLSERLRGIVYIEDARFKLDRYALASGGTPPGSGPDPDADETRSNLSIGAGLGIALGGSKFDRRSDREPGWSFASIPVEPFAGRIDFDDRALGEQDLAGIRSGINVGNHLSLRGYYWRGVGTFFNDTDPIQSYGAEAQFNFRPGVGISPFLVVGAGNLDFRPEYRDRNGLERSDRTILLAGAGLGIRLTDQFRLNVGVRDYIYSDAGLDDVSSTSELRHNPLFSAGLTFAIGRGRSAPETTMPPVAQQPARVDTVTVTRAAADADTGEVRTRRMPATREESRTVTLPVPERGELYVRYGDSEPGAPDLPSRDMPNRSQHAGLGFGGQPTGLTAADLSLLRQEIREVVRMELARGAPADSPPVRPAVARDTMVSEARILQRMDSLLARRLADVPAPTVRVDTVRLTPDTVRMTRADTVRVKPDTVWLQPAPALANPEASEDRLLRRVDSLITMRMAEREERRDELARMEDRLNERLDRSLDREPAVTQVPTPAPVIVTPAAAGPSDSSAAVPGPAPTFRALQPTLYTGLSFEGPNQVLLGGRLDLSPYVDWGSFALVPELALGLFNGTSAMGAANLQYELPSFEVRGRSLIPVARLGLGFLRVSDDGDSSTEGVLNFTYGVSTPIGGPTLTGERRHLFVEHQGIDFFDVNRLLVGVQWRY